MIDEARRRHVELDAVDRRSLEAIDVSGRALVAVGPSRNERFAQFAYTIGLSRLDSPEVIVIGIDPSPACQILNDICTVALNGKRINVGLLPGILGGDYILDLREMNALHYDEYLGRLLWFHEHFGTGRLRVLQAVWPDKLGRYPDDPRLTDEERARFVEAQPLLDGRLSVA
jgi:hypothetical protein